MANSFLLAEDRVREMETTEREKRARQRHGDKERRELTSEVREI